MLRFLETLGGKTLEVLDSLYGVFHFALLCFMHALNPRSYNPAMRMVLIKQLYFTAVEILPLFISMAVLFGSVIIGVVISLAAAYSLENSMGSILVTFVIDEFAPFFTALLISLRSGAAINTEIAVMQVNNELNTLQKYRIDIIDYLFLPRILSGITSSIFLSLLFAIIMLTSGFVFTFFYMDIDFPTYRYLLLDALGVKDFVLLLVKSFAFGVITMLIPIYSGLKTQKSYTAIPISVLHGMVQLFIALFVIEVISLILQSL